jgi:hypothetical protein
MGCNQPVGLFGLRGFRASGEIRWISLMVLCPEWSVRGVFSAGFAVVRGMERSGVGESVLRS